MGSWPKRSSIAGPDAGRPSGGRRGDAPAHPGSPGRGRALGVRPHRYPGPVAAAHLAPSQAAGRGRAGRAAPGGGLGLLPPDRPGRGACRSFAPIAGQPRPRRSAACWTIATRLEAVRAPALARRRRPISRASRPNGTASAPCMRRRRWSRPRCSMRSGRSRSAISLDLGTGTGRMLRTARAARRPRRRARCQPRDAVRRPRQSRKGRPAPHRGAAGRHLCAAVRRATPSISSSSIRCCTISTIRRARIREAARLVAPGRPAPVVDFAPHELEFLREAPGASPPRLRARADRRLARGSRARLHAHAGEIAPPGEAASEQFTVSLWLGQDRRVVTRLAARPNRQRGRLMSALTPPPQPAGGAADQGLLRVLPAEDRRRWKRRCGRRSSGSRRSSRTSSR